MLYSGKIWILLLCTNLLGVALTAQKTYSEEEITRERLFLEAYEKKIIGKYDEAIALYTKLYQQDPQSHATAYELARIYDLQEQDREAIRWMQLAQKGDPNNVYYQEQLAELLQQAGRFEEASDTYADLTKQQPSNEYYYYRWAYYLVRAGKIERAIKVYDDLEKLVGINEEITRRKHALYLGQGETKKALRELQKLIQAFPDYVEYHLLLAAFYEQLDDQKSAQATYRQILQIDPENAEAQMALAGRSASSNNEVQYLLSLRSAFEQSDVNIDLKIGKILPFIQKVADTGDAVLADAVLELTQILERVHPDEAKAYAAAGDLYFYSDRRSLARDKYQHTLELDQTVYTVWEQMANLHLLQGDYLALLETTNEAIDIFPNKAKLYYFYGIAALETGQYEEAQDMLDQAVLMAGNDGQLKQQILSGLGQAYTALGDYEAADKTFTEALELFEKAPQVLARYSLSLSAREGAGQRALQLAEEALKLAPEAALPLQAKGRALYQAQNYAEAQSFLQQAISKEGEPSLLLLEHYGDVLFQVGDTEGALRQWQKARDLGRQSKQLEKKISDRKL